MRTRTAGAQGLLVTGFKCNPTTGQRKKTTISISRQEQDSVRLV